MTTRACHELRWMLLTFCVLLLVGNAQATDTQLLRPVDWRPVLIRLQRVAAPWCGEQTFRDSEGRMRCRVLLAVLPHSVPAGAMGPGLLTLSQGALDLLPEDELAHVLAHEFAHFVLGHPLIALRRLRPDQLARAAERAGKNTSEFLDWMAMGIPPVHAETPTDRHEIERDADTLGLYLAGLAGYPVAAQASLWKRLAEYPALNAAATATHPSMPDRSAHLHRVALRFCEQLLEGHALVPDAERLRPSMAPEEVASLRLLRSGVCPL